jgi:hypothetical protein
MATVLDDVAVLTRVTTHNTVGVVGDDPASNAERAAGARVAGS